MKAIIPVAGVGSRLRPHTYTLPKVLLNVAGKPILGHILDQLVEAGVTRLSLVVGQMRSQIEEYVRTHYELPVEFPVQEEAKGLGHAVSLGLSEDDQEVLVILGDTIFEVDLSGILHTGTHTSLAVKDVEDPRRFGVVETDGDRVTRLVEKPEHPRSNSVIVGIYLIRNAPLLRKCIHHLFDRQLTTRGEYQLTDALQLMIEEGEHMTVFQVDNWLDCGKPETLLETNRYLLNRMNRKTPEVSGTAVIIPPVYIHPEAILERAIIGPFATVGKAAVVRDAMVRDSILGEGAVVESALVEQSLVGNNAAIAGSFRSYNVGDSSEIVFRHNSAD